MKKETENLEELFDDWAKDYDESVRESERNESYPFAGYTEIKDRIIKLIMERSNTSILDMGVGTGEITRQLYGMGFTITGVDLSPKMIDIAKKNMPEASFIQSEFNSSLSLLTRKYDFVIFNYSIHHLRYEEQISLLENLSQHLNEEATVIIGDISKATEEELGELRGQYEEIWDDEEFYPLVEHYQNDRLKDLYTLNYTQVNQVAGLYVLKKS